MRNRFSGIRNIGASMVTLVFTMAVSPSAGETKPQLCQGNFQSEAQALEEHVTRIDSKLVEETERDIRAWLDARIAATGDFGVYPFMRDELRLDGDTLKLDLNRGGCADSAAQFFRAYETLGDRAYLAAGLKTADFFIQIQQVAGHFPSGATIQRGGKASAGGGKHPPHVARLEDGYQFRPFCLLLYAFRLTGNMKYHDAALRCGEFITQRAQNPDWGWCPSYFDTTNPAPHSEGETRTGDTGVAGGGSYADSATTDGFRISIIMYYLTGERKYLARSARLGDWMFATQIGQGKVRGWADNYDSRNRPVAARDFEGLLIDPRNFNRFTGPMLVWFHLMTGEERYRRLFEESYLWLRHQEQPNGWAAEYTYDGHAAWTHDFKSYRYDQPETWPKAAKPGFSRIKVQLDDAATWHRLLQEGGRDGLRRGLYAPVRADAEGYAAARLAAAMRCADEELVLRLADLTKNDVAGAIDSRYLERVRLRLAAPDAKALPAKDGMGRSGLTRQSWWSPHNWAEPYRPPPGWASWQFTWDARLARGQIDAKAALPGGRGLELMHLWPDWDVMGDWTTRCLAVEDWMAVPLATPSK